MRPTHQVTVRTSSFSRTTALPAARPPALDESLEAPKSPPPLPRLGTADRICDALRRWLEEDM
jgi:hypothetical protein